MKMMITVMYTVMTMRIEGFCGFDHEPSKRGGGSEKEEYFTNAHKASALLIGVVLILKSALQPSML